MTLLAAREINWLFESLENSYGDQWDTEAARKHKECVATLSNAGDVSPEGFANQVRLLMLERYQDPMESAIFTLEAFTLLGKSHWCADNWT